MIKVLVAGSAHLDILARPATQSEHRDRCGTTSIEVGGTACNVALALRGSGLDVRFMTAWNTAPITKLIASYIASFGIEVAADDNPFLPLGSFVAQLTPEGDMASAVSSTPVEMHNFTTERVDEAITDVVGVVLDANLNPQSIKLIAERAHAFDTPVFVLGVSEDKVDRILAAAGLITAAFVNHAEVERLMHTITAAEPGEVAAFLKAPLVVTRGERGAVVYHPDGTRTRLFSEQIDGVANLLGVGDAFSAGVIDGMLRFNLDFAAASDYAKAFVVRIARSNACNANSINAIDMLVGGLWEVSQKDTLTGLSTRRYLEAEALRYEGGTNALFMIDCDNFKQVNDTHGHTAGDQVLRRVASILKDSIRSVDIACRFGGDEFVVLLPRTGIDEAKLVARRMRDATAAVDLNGVTLSIGMTIAHKDEDFKLGLQRADEAMYCAKRAGKNIAAVALRDQATIVMTEEPADPAVGLPVEFQTDLCSFGEGVIERVDLASGFVSVRETSTGALWTGPKDLVTRLADEDVTAASQ